MPESNLGPLDAAATALLAVGCADPFATDPAIRVRCVWIVEQLRVMGASPEPRLEPLAADEADDAIDAALESFGSLPSDFSTKPGLADAIAKLRTVQAVG